MQIFRRNTIFRSAFTLILLRAPARVLRRPDHLRQSYANQRSSIASCFSATRRFPARTFSGREVHSFSLTLRGRQRLGETHRGHSTPRSLTAQSAGNPVFLGRDAVRALRAGKPAPKLNVYAVTPGRRPAAGEEVPVLESTEREGIRAAIYALPRRNLTHVHCLKTATKPGIICIRRFPPRENPYSPNPERIPSWCSI